MAVDLSGNCLRLAPLFLPEDAAAAMPPPDPLDATPADDVSPSPRPAAELLQRLQARAAAAAERDGEWSVLTTDEKRAAAARASAKLPTRAPFQRREAKVRPSCESCFSRFVDFIDITLCEFKTYSFSSCVTFETDVDIKVLALKEFLLSPSVLCSPSV